MKPPLTSFPAAAGCRYHHRYEKLPATHDPLYFFVPSLGTRDAEHPDTDTQKLKHGYIAVKSGNIWGLEDALMVYDPSSGLVTLECQELDARSGIAFPIDPVIDFMDIIGATNIYPNADHTAWLFRHESQGHRHDHLLAVRSAVVGLFQPALDNINLKALEARSAARANRIEKFLLLCQFRDDVIEAAETAEKAHHLGYHAQTPYPPFPEEGHVHSAINVAMSAAKTAWSATPPKAAEYAKITSDVAPLLAYTTAPHNPETRWEKAARIEAEAKAKAEAEAAASSEATPA